jgi:hypothetical protein
VRVVNASGIISTLAGNASKSFGGDGGIANSASLARPRGLSVDGAGNIYIADSDNNRIRLIAKTGNITTVAGNGFQGFAGDGGPAVNAALDTPRAPVVQASGAFALSDTRNQLVRQVYLNGDTHTISGNNPGTGSGQGFFETLTLNGASVVAFGTGALTATFRNSNLTATGQVTLLDITSGAIPSGLATLSANLATFSTSVLTPGIHRLVASYAGDALNAPVTSSVFVITITPPPITDFTLATTGVTTLSVNPGQTASFTFALQPQGANVTPPITLSATGLPPGATAVFTPATITSSSAATSFGLAIKTASLKAERAVPFSPTRTPLLPISAAICLLPLLRGRPIRSKLAKVPRTFFSVLFVLLGSAVILGVTGCGSGGFFALSPQTYTITVTAIGASAANTTLQHTTTVTLIVQ